MLFCQLFIGVFNNEVEFLLRNAIRSDQFLSLMMFKYSKSLAEPGEAVGLLAGQVKYFITNESALRYVKLLSTLSITC